MKDEETTQLNKDWNDMINRGQVYLFFLAVTIVLIYLIRWLIK